MRRPLFMKVRVMVQSAGKRCAAGGHSYLLIPMRSMDGVLFGTIEIARDEKPSGWKMSGLLSQFSETSPFGKAQAGSGAPHHSWMVRPGPPAGLHADGGRLAMEPTGHTVTTFGDPDGPLPRVMGMPPFPPRCFWQINDFNMFSGGILL